MAGIAHESFAINNVCFRDSDIAQSKSKDNSWIFVVGMIMGSSIVLLALTKKLDIYHSFGLVLIKAQLLAPILGLLLATAFVLPPFRHVTPRT